MAVKKSESYKYIREDSFKCKFVNIKGPVTRYKIKKYFPNAVEFACWAQIGSRTEYRNGKTEVYDIKKNIHVLIRDVNNGIRAKYLKNVVEFINDITPCKIIKHNKEICIVYKLLHRHTSNLFLLNLVRMLWYTPNHQFGERNEATERFFRELFNIYNTKKVDKDFDHILVLTSLIKRRVHQELVKGIRTKSYHEGDHSFFYNDIIPKTSKDFILWTEDKNKKKGITAFSSFLKAIAIK